MSNSAPTTANTPESGCPTSSIRPANPHYANSPGQRARWSERLKHRRMTYRKLGLYVLVAVVVALSAPIVPTFIIGSLLVAVGLALRIWTFGHLEKNQAMITTGPYAHSRNPAYLGSFAICCGVVLAAGSPFSVAGLLVWGLGLVMLVIFFRSYLPRKYAREYPRLEQAFPQSYKAHAANVPNFFPRLTPWRSGDTRSFSWACVRANHELWWPAALGLALAFIWFV